MTTRRLHTILALAVTCCLSCEKDFDINTGSGSPLLVVEAYINNQLPLYNYVILTRSQDYKDTSFATAPVTGAQVSITEGDLLPGGAYAWNAATRVQLKETKLPQLGGIYLPGVYFDTTLANNPARALKGQPGKYYLLQITTAGKEYTAVTTLLPIVPIDSLTVGFHYTDFNKDRDTTLEKARVTIHYKDPDTIGNTQLHYWQHWGTLENFGWGGLGSNRFIPGTDDLVNGQYIHLTQPTGFVIGDSIQYYMISAERNVYNFWDSYNKARANSGPFSTPVVLHTNITGEAVTGCFSGFSVSTKSIIIR